MKYWGEWRQGTYAPGDVVTFKDATWIARVATMEPPGGDGWERLTRRGLPGIDGPPGERGPKGLRGPRGPEGKQGPEGPQGNKGDPGPQGIKGETGPEGPQGEEGPEGPEGARGKQGPQGIEGKRGPRGERGPEGAKGEKGDQGERGPEGPTGPQGAKGERGPQGPQGPKAGVGDAVIEFATNGKLLGEVTRLDFSGSLGANIDQETGFVHVLAGGGGGGTGPPGPKGDKGDPGEQGPPGEPGGSTGAVTLSREADEDLSGHRLVVTTDTGTVRYADNTDPDDVSRVIYLTTSAALAGDMVDLVAFGEVTEGSWTWTPGEAIYMDTAGALTQTAPVSPDVFLITVGSAITADTIQFNPKIPILLAP